MKVVNKTLEESRKARELEEAKEWSRCYQYKLSQRIAKTIQAYEESEEVSEMPYFVARGE